MTLRCSFVKIEVVRADLATSVLVDGNHFGSTRYSHSNNILGQAPLREISPCLLLQTPTKCGLTGVGFLQVFLYFHVAINSLMDYYVKSDYMITRKIRNLK